MTVASPDPAEAGGEDPAHNRHPLMTVVEVAAAKNLIELTGSDSRIELVDRPADDPEQRQPDLTLAETLLGYEPRITPEEGLRRTIAFFRH